MSATDHHQPSSGYELEKLPVGEEKLSGEDNTASRALSMDTKVQDGSEEAAGVETKEVGTGAAAADEHKWLSGAQLAIVTTAMLLSYVPFLSFSSLSLVVGALGCISLTITLNMVLCTLTSKTKTVSS